MKCSSCGAETKGKFCEYCGSELPQEKATVNITNNYYNATPKEYGEANETTGKCPKCGNAKITFKRERISTTTQSSSRKNFIGTGRKGEAISQSNYRTVGICQNCGYTWNPNAVNSNARSGKKTWLWVLGWIFIFPIPLTILLLRNKEMKPAVKYSIIAAAWILYFIIGLSSNSNTDSSPTYTPSYTESSQSDKTTENNDDNPQYPMYISSTDHSNLECWLINEPASIGNEIIFDVYANVDTTHKNWHNQVKDVVALLWNKYNNENVMFKIYNGTHNLDKKQPTYDDLIAIWQENPFSATSESQSTITWYPEGWSVAALQETECWHP